jgi:hypothetical protein
MNRRERREVNGRTGRVISFAMHESFILRTSESGRINIMRSRIVETLPSSLASSFDDKGGEREGRERTNTATQVNESMSAIEQR